MLPKPYPLLFPPKIKRFQNIFSKNLHFKHSLHTDAAAAIHNTVLTYIHFPSLWRQGSHSRPVRGDDFLTVQLEMTLFNRRSSSRRRFLNRPVLETFNLRFSCSVILPFASMCEFWSTGMVNITFT